MSAEKHRALGRGLDALLPAANKVTTASGVAYGDRSVFLCPIEALKPQKGQPRQRINEATLNELAESLRDHGLIEPLVVRKLDGPKEEYEIVAGERRWRAAQRAGLKELLVVVKDLSPASAFEMALIENLQREDLGPIEFAEAIERLIREHDYKQEEVAQRLKKDRTTIANALRLLKLPARVRSMVVEGTLSEGHARALLGLTDSIEMERLADKAARGKLSVRAVEHAVREQRRESSRPGAAAKPKAASRSANVRDMEVRMGRQIGLRVELHDDGGKGRVVVHYGNLDDFDRFLRAIGLA